MRGLELVGVPCPPPPHDLSLPSEAWGHQRAALDRLVVCRALDFSLSPDRPLEAQLGGCFLGKSVPPEADWSSEGVCAGTFTGFQRMEGVDFLGIMVGLGIWDVGLFFNAQNSFLKNSTLLAGNEGMIVSAHLLRQPPWGREWWAIKRGVGWPLATGKAQEGGGIWQDPLDTENHSG